MPEGAEILARVRRIRAALPPGPSELRTLVVELETWLEAAGADEGEATG